MKKSLLLASALFTSQFMFAGGVFAQAAGATDDADTREIIVTGVFGAKAIEDAPISINVVTSAEIQQHAAVSAADLLKSVPGWAVMRPGAIPALDEAAHGVYSDR